MPNDMRRRTRTRRPVNQSRVQIPQKDLGGPGHRISRKSQIRKKPFQRESGPSARASDLEGPQLYL